MNNPDRLRALLAKPDFVVMPAVWDGLSAKLAAAAGFKTAFLSGSCVAASRLGGPDLDLFSFAEMFDSLQHGPRRGAADLLVLADGDHGYGNAMNVQRTVRAYGRAGAAAILIEDKITPRALTAAGKPCLPREEARMKIRAAVEAAKDPASWSWRAPTAGRPRASTRRWRASRCTSRRAPTSCSSTCRPTRPRSAAPLPLPRAGRPSPCSRPARRGPRRRRKQAAELGFKIGTFPTGMLSPATAGMKAGLAALKAGEAEAKSALPPPELRLTLGYAEYDAKAKPFVL